MNRELTKEVRKAVWWRRASSIGMWVLVLCLVAAVAILGVRDHYRGEAVKRLGSALDSTRQQVIECAKINAASDNCQKPKSANAKQLIKSIPGPVDVPISAGPSGPPGPAGPSPTDEQVQNAVDLYCSSGRCDGKTPTKQQVAVAVASYCDANGQCQGPKGKPGKNGADGVGVQGEKGDPGDTGKQGPPPSDQQISDAINSYCANHNDCAGPVGPAGADGRDAVPFSFTFTVPGFGPNDDTTYTVSCDTNRNCTTATS